jgi:N-carbamoyl-L-amino-acid hydrolase
LRDLSLEKLMEIARDIRARAAAIASATKTQIAINDLSRNPPALADEDVQRVIERASAGLTLTTQRQPSGAGHDAQMMAQLGPMGMIFVPSVGGISHSPKEFSHAADIVHGANVLLGAVVAADGA